MKILIASYKKMEILRKLGNLILFQSKKNIFRIDKSQSVKKTFSWQEEMSFQKMDLDELFSLASKKSNDAHLMPSQNSQE